MSWSNDAITRSTADTVQAAIADGIPVPARHGPRQALQALGLATNQQPPAVASTVTVDRNDHAAAAAYLMRHHGTTALLILDGASPTGRWESSPRLTSSRRQRTGRT